jgi:hypothetical protein
MQVGYAQALSKVDGSSIDVHADASPAVRHDMIVEPSALRAFFRNQWAMVGKAQMHHSTARDQAAESGVTALGLKLQGQARGPVSLECPIVQHIRQLRNWFLKGGHKKYNEQLQILSRGLARLVGALQLAKQIERQE